MRRDTREYRWLCACLLLATPFVWRSARSSLPGEAELQSVGAALLRPTIVLPEVRAAHPERAELLGQRQTPAHRALERELDARVHRAEVAADFAALRVPRHPFVAAVRKARPRRRGTRPTLLDLDLPCSETLAVRLAGTPVVVGRSLVGFLASERNARGELVVQTLADRPVRARIRRVVAEAASESDASLPTIKLVVEGAGARDPHPLQAYLTTPRHFDTWSEGRFPFRATTKGEEKGRGVLPAGLEVGIIEDWGYLDRNFVLNRYLRPDWDARSLVRVVLYLRPADVAALRQARAQVPEVRSVPLRLAWQSPRGLRFQRAVLHGRALTSGDGVFREDQLVGVVTERVRQVVHAEAVGSTGQRLPALARLSASDEVLPLVLEGLGLSARGARFRVLWPEELGRSLLGARLHTGVRDVGFPTGFRIGVVAAHRGQELEVEIEDAGAWPGDLSGFARAGVSMGSTPVPSGEEPR